MFRKRYWLRIVEHRTGATRYERFWTRKGAAKQLRTHSKAGLRAVYDFALLDIRDGWEIRV